MNKIIQYLKRLFKKPKVVKQKDLFKWFGKFEYTDEIKAINKNLEKSKDNY
jgi:transposase